MKRTPLYNEHLKLKAKMVEFGGWEMPVVYTSVIEEHLAVRHAAGIFDVSHMGEFEFKGKDALACVQYLTTNDISKIENGQAIYSLLCNEHGTLVDDIIVYRFNPEHILFVVNASNIEKDWVWVTQALERQASACQIKNVSDDFALIALQGPKAAEILNACHSRESGNPAHPHETPAYCRGGDILTIKPFHFVQMTIAGVKNCIVARTGYTGEDGFEIFCPPSDAPKIWSSLIETGTPLGLKPAGLGSRDTLRLEMKYSLYGHEINDKTNPIEAGLSWVVKLDKNSDFIGKTAIEKVKAEGIKRKCIGFKMIDEGIPREGYKIYAHDEIGHVTSGTMSPSLGHGIGIGYVPIEFSEKGSKISIDIRGRMRLAEIVETPFYRKGNPKR